MQNNKFCIFSRKSLKLKEAKNAPSHFLIYKSKESKTNQINEKMREKIFLKFYKRENEIQSTSLNCNEFVNNNYYISQKILMKYNKNYDSMIINNIILRKKCHFYAIYNDNYMFINNEIEYIKKYYSFNESIKIIPKRQIYFKHLMIYIERPIYKDFLYNKILKSKGLEKLNIYKRKNYPNKYNKKNKISLDNNILSNSNIIFNSNVIETIENCSTSLTQCSNKKINNIKNINKNKITHPKNIEKKNINESIISEIKYNGCQNKRSDANDFCIDNSLLIVMKDLAISPNLINNYLYKHNTNYKKLYNKMKNKSKTITNSNRKNKDVLLKGKERQKKAIITELSKEKLNCLKSSETNLIRKINQINKNEVRNSISLIRKINNIKIKQFNSNIIKSSSNIENQNLNSCCNFNKFGLSLENKIQSNQKLRQVNKKLSLKETNPILFNYFNKVNKEKRKEKNINNIFNKNIIKFQYNNKVILKGIKEIISNQRPKNKSLRRYTNTQKFWADSLFDMNSLNENETRKMIQTINPVKSISISDNQFFKSLKEFGTDINNEK